MTSLLSVPLCLIPHPSLVYLGFNSQQFADDYRLFCGDLGNEVNDDVLSKAFSRFPSFNMARVTTLLPSVGKTYSW